MVNHLLTIYNGFVDQFPLGDLARRDSLDGARKLWILNLPGERVGDDSKIKLGSRHGDRALDTLGEAL